MSPLPPLPSVPAIPIPGGEALGGAGMPPIGKDVFRPVAGAPATEIANTITQKMMEGHEAHEMLMDIAAKQKPSLTETVNPQTAIKPETSQTSDAETAVTQKVESGLKQWESDHQVQDKQNITEVSQWIHDRADTEKQLVVTEYVKQDMASWHAKNPEPDKANTTQHEQWEARRNAANNESTEKHKQKYEAEQKKREQEELGMSVAEFTEKLHQIEDLRGHVNTLTENIYNLSMSTHQNETTHDQIRNCTEMRNLAKARIDALQTELKVDASISTGNKKTAKIWLIPAVIAAGLVAMPAALEMNRENNPR